jgi:hypothetical protein
MEMAGRNVSSTARSRMESTEDRGILHTMATSGITDTKRFLDRFTQVIAERICTFQNLLLCMQNLTVKLEFSSMLFDGMKNKEVLTYYEL